MRTKESMLAVRLPAVLVWASAAVATVGVAAERDWSVCDLPPVLRDQCCQSIPSVLDQGDAWFAQNYLDQRPALVKQVGVLGNDAAAWSGRRMLLDHSRQKIQVISVPQKKELQPSPPPPSGDNGAGVRGKPVSMAMEEFAQQFLGCTSANVEYAHVRPYVFSGARDFLKILNYTYPKLQLTCRPPEPKVRSRMNFEKISAPVPGVQDYVYIE